MFGEFVVPSRSRELGRAVRPDVDEPAVVLRPGPSTPAVDVRDDDSTTLPEASPSIDIRWSADGGCTVELRGLPTRSMLAEARDILWSRSPSDRLTVVVTHAVLTRSLFALLIAGRRRLSSRGVFEIVGLDASGARRIADSRGVRQDES